MSLWEYLAQLDTRLRASAAIIVNSSIQQDIDANLEIGFVKGWIAFLDGSLLEFPFSSCRPSGKSSASTTWTSTTF